ncbi:Aste57867_10361 [Aphanomyces stellatus]|uniref:Aste57867_10361 protein n=1 Tax=Aphanomyces stellatus TaxID=120398 RepID=A0A485KQP5_9STRA|nr:hypothetical protein As57867_010321 [Aphanomyces stellatus]VFT87235.1 Aste57867_10361 [Aphanomyces stellatus]
MPDASTAQQPHQEPRKKTVGFTQATIYWFQMDYGGSAVPDATGPPIGLARRHVDLETIDLFPGQPQPCVERKWRRRVGRLDLAKRIVLLQKAGYSRMDIMQMCREAITIRQSRAASSNNDQGGAYKINFDGE